MTRMLTSGSFDPRTFDPSYRPPSPAAQTIQAAAARASAVRRQAAMQPNALAAASPPPGAGYSNALAAPQPAMPPVGGNALAPASMQPQAAPAPPPAMAPAAAPPPMARAAAPQMQPPPAGAGPTATPRYPRPIRSPSFERLSPARPSLSRSSPSLADAETHIAHATGFLLQQPGAITGADIALQVKAVSDAGKVDKEAVAQAVSKLPPVSDQDAPPSSARDTARAVHPKPCRSPRRDAGSAIGCAEPRAGTLTDGD